MNLIDEKELEKLGKTYKIDKKNNKITGKFILKSFVHSILSRVRFSLRLLELMGNRNKERSSGLNAPDPSKKQIDPSSLGKRLETMNIDYFKKNYKDLVEKYNHQFVKKQHERFFQFNSTVMTLSGKWLKDGINASGVKNR